MNIDPNEIKKIAHLARIALDENEVVQFSQNISQLLTLVDQMQAIDTSNVEPMFHPLDMTQRLREDTTITENQRDTLLALAPQSEDGLYLVPQVIE